MRGPSVLSGRSASVLALTRRGVVPTATVSPVIGPCRHPSVGDLQQGENLQSEPT